MTPADLIETALRENMRVCVGVPMSGAEAEDAARIALAAFKAAGLAVVSAEDLDDAIDALCEREDVCFGEDCSVVHCQRVNRLRAALPERTDHA